MLFNPLIMTTWFLHNLSCVFGYCKATVGAKNTVCVIQKVQSKSTAFFKSLYAFLAPQREC